MTEKKRVTVLGAGLVGSVLAADLASDSDLTVTLADVDAARLERAASRWSVQTAQADLSDPDAIKAVVKDADFVAGALPGHMGLAALRAVIGAEKNCCDISFMPEDPRALDDLARERGVTVVVDCGVAPGMSNLLVGWASAELDKVSNVAIYVGGLPADPCWPFRYKAPFSPADVIEEYVRPARIVAGGERVERDALSEVETIVFDEIGELEAFNTDGLRSLLDTIDAPNMVEKTMRYPGHAEQMRVFRETGLFATEPITVGDATVRPRDVASALLFPMWRFEEGEADITIMRVVVEGDKAGDPVRFTWNLFDRHDPKTGFHSMARTTAFPAAIVARMILDGEYRRRGVAPPELLGREPGATGKVLSELEKRGVHFLRH